MAETKRPAARGALADRVDIGMRTDFTQTGQRVQGQLVAALPRTRANRSGSRSIATMTMITDLRLYADKGVEQVPTRKGLTIRPDLLPAVIEALQKAEAAARKEGLL